MGESYLLNLTNNEVVRIHDNYAVVTDDKPLSITILFRKFHITEHNRIEKVSLKLTKNVYELLMPIHL